MSKCTYTSSPSISHWISWPLRSTIGPCLQFAQSTISISIDLSVVETNIDSVVLLANGLSTEGCSGAADGDSKNNGPADLEHFAIPISSMINKQII